jgi:hypothetical protein
MALNTPIGGESASSWKDGTGETSGAGTGLVGTRRACRALAMVSSKRMPVSGLLSMYFCNAAGAQLTPRYNEVSTAISAAAHVP